MKPLLVTAGEPAGIGADLCLALAQHSFNFPFVVLADPTLLTQRAVKLGIEIELLYYEYGEEVPIAPQGSLYIWPIPLRDRVITGKLNPANSDYVLEMLERATHACLDGVAAGIVTAPVQKSVINEAGIAFSGHTEFLQTLCGVDKVVMMLACAELKVALATTHLPLRQVPDAITPQLLQQIVRITHHDLQKHFGITAPRLYLTGLNPHAGENGYLGHEEQDIINPTMAQLRLEGIQVSNALAADTLFTSDNLAQCDAVIAMYHDQGLPVLKAKGFGEAVNITLGLPIIRTSVDHGTALHLAGTGQAKVSSLLAALNMAAQMAYHG